MLKIKKRLTITIDEPRECEEENTQSYQINKEFTQYKGQENRPFYENQHMLFDEERNKIMELNNPFINLLFQYMEGENPGSDYSYNWY
jgi:hypothetical protein